MEFQGVQLVYYKMCITIKLVHMSFTAHNYFFVLIRVRTLKLYCQSNCQIQRLPAVTPLSVVVRLHEYLA